MPSLALDRRVVRGVPTLPVLDLHQVGRKEDGPQRVAELMAEHGEELIALANGAPSFILSASTSQGLPHRAEQAARRNRAIERGHVPQIDW
jgi:hypothetical protein